MQGLTIEQAATDFKALLDRLEVHGEARTLILTGCETVARACIKEFGEAAKVITRNLLADKD